jgi:hypothetical protein
MHVPEVRETALQLLPDSEINFMAEEHTIAIFRTNVT